MKIYLAVLKAYKNISCGIKANENISGGTQSEWKYISGGTQSKWKYIERYTKQMKTVNCDLNKTFYNFEIAST